MAPDETPPPIPSPQEIEQTEQRLQELQQEQERVSTGWELCKDDPHRASPESKYKRYNVTVDHDEGDRATEIKLNSLQRPHMRALHCAWISFFFAFMIWFAPAPLLPEIRDSLGLDNKDLWNANIANDVIAVLGRIVMGPICDNYAARIPMAIVLVLGSIPTACVGLVNSASGLAIVRFFIGIAGSSFVMAQFWPSRMFAREISGTANGLVGGWGNLGGAWAQLFMGTILFPAFEDYYDGDSTKAWRVICVIPASIAFTWGCILPFVSDDAPLGSYTEMKKRGTMDRVFFTTSLRSGATINTWILYVQYAASFGVELVMNNAAVLYFVDEFGASTSTASTLSFCYGAMNIFARVMGGFFSDKLNIRVGMRGRLWLITLLLIAEGAMIIVFAFTDSQAGAVVVMCIFSIFTQAAEGAIYGVVPYVTKLYTGSVAGLVGSGGNMGSIIYGLLFRSLPFRDAFLAMGCIVISSSFLSLFFNIPCHAGLLRGEDNHAVIAARDRFRRRREMERMLVDESRLSGVPLSQIRADGPSTGSEPNLTTDIRASVSESSPDSTAGGDPAVVDVEGGGVVAAEAGTVEAGAAMKG